MKRVVLTITFLGLVLGVGLANAKIPEPFDLDGREITVRVVRNHRPEESNRLEVLTAVIDCHAIRLDLADANESTNIVLRAAEQKDELVKKLIGDRPLEWPYRGGPVFYLPKSPDAFEGREVVARVYNNWRQEPAAFEQMRFPLRGGRLSIAPGQVGDNAVLVMLGSDQQDPVLRRWMGLSTRGWAYRAGMQITLQDRPSVSKEKDLWWTFLDPLGAPIAGADVEICVVPEGRWVRIAEAKLDDKGQAKIPFTVGIGAATVDGRGFRTGWLGFKISAPAYGTALLEPYPSARQVLLVPLVARGSEAYLRSAFGAVLDPQGIPVAGAVVRASALYPLGADPVNLDPHQKCAVLADRQGRFSLYVPVAAESLGVGELIPPRTEYFVEITPPDGQGLLNFQGRIPNGQDNVLTLEHAGYFRRFVFEDENGPITEPNRLGFISLTVTRPGRPDLTFEYSQWKEGGLFPLGRYDARMFRRGGWKFSPIEVNTKSPETLVFRLRRDEKIDYGLVVNAVTGEPMPGAFVVDLIVRQEGADPSGMTAEQWAALHALPSYVSPSERAVSQPLSPVCHLYTFDQLVRADANGLFEISLSPKRTPENLVVFEQDYLPVHVPPDSAKEVERGLYEVPVVKLFPAARVAFEPWLNGYKPDSPATFLLAWMIDRTASPKWAEPLVAWCEQQSDLKSQDGFSFHHSPFSFYVPAGPELQVRMSMLDQYRWSPAVFAGPFRLQQGQTVILNRQQLQPAVLACAQVLDSDGLPVEGVPVAACHRFGRMARSTDANGLVVFDLPPASKGEFIVECKDADPAPLIRQSIPYEVAGPQDANRIYTIRLSDEMLKALFK